MILKRTLLACLTTAWLYAGGAPALAQDPDPQAPATFAADEMTHDKELGTITARGHVEVNQGGRTLLADAISYDQGRDTIRASGGVTLHRPNGDVLFADTMEISGDLKNGLIEDFRAVLADRSRFAASRAELVNDETMTLDRAVYSPCQPCQDDPSRPLLWQLKAVRVVHDRVNKVVEYENAWLEFAGVPVLYTPYLTHPDPTVKRKTGLLPPRVGASSHLGMVAEIPYFYVLDEHSDVTLTPILTSKENGALVGEYRDRFTKGELNTEASLAYDSTRNVLGHIDATSRFNINESWRWGVDLKRASSSTYMRRYGLGNEPILTSQAFTEGFRGKNYANVSAMAFQDMRTGVNTEASPLVLPMAQYSHQGEANRLGAYNTLDTQVVMLQRDAGTGTGTNSNTDATRISVKPAWNLPYIAPMGDVYKLTASMGIDFFHTQNLDVPAARGTTYNGAALRVTPQIELDWRWPLARRSGTVTEVIEPIAQIIASPYGGNSYKMANEDSQELDFNDTNLFSANRFTGLDRVESGPRANYGLKWSVYGDKGGSTSVLVGQSYRVANDDTFQTGSGLENNLSDYIARVQMSPGKHLNLLYRTRLDKKTLDFKRNELGLSGRAGWFNYRSDFVFFERQQGSQFPGRKELNYGLGAKITDTWSTSFAGVRDLSANGGQRSSRLGLAYDDECFRFESNMSRTYFLDRDIKPTDAIMFRLVFKTLGEVSSNVLPTSF